MFTNWCDDESIRIKTKKKRDNNLIVLKEARYKNHVECTTI